MIYVQRNSEGLIVAVCAGPQPGYADEALEENDEEVVAFYDSLTKKYEPTK